MMNGVAFEQTRVRPGIEAIRPEDAGEWVGARVGLLTNPSALNTEFVHTLDALTDGRPHFTIAAIFTPEHGFTASALDGEHVQSSFHPRLGIPIHSLYGETMRPTPDMLDGLDWIICDIQDIGARYYTYMWTLTYLLEAAAEHDISVMVMDRPNPLGDAVRGPILQMETASIVGRAPVPIQHGMTIGELATMFNDLWNPSPAKVTRVRCLHYHRAMRWEETGLPFVPPSPAMAHLVTAQHYPGACLIEGTTLSEGRGTALPFEIVGAPGIDGDKLTTLLNSEHWPGVRFRPHTFVPTASKHAGQACGGVQAHITDLNAYDPVRTWLGVLLVIRDHFPGVFGWVEHNGVFHFDRLIGNRTARPAINAGATLADLTATWAADEAAFREQRRPYLLYE